MTTPRQADPIEPAEVYTLIKGIAVIGRGAGTVQIGSEPPAAVILHHPPPHAISILRSLDGTTPLRAVLVRHQADVRTWTTLLADLRDARLLVPVTQWWFAGSPAGPVLESERDSLVQRHGIPRARLVLQARRDAVVVVRGSGRVATAIAAGLLASGVGHVHQQPDRALRLAELPDPEPAVGSGPPQWSPATTHGGRDVYRDRQVDIGAGAAIKAAGALLAAHHRRVAPDARVHAPPAHQRVALTVLAGDGPPSPSLAAELTDRRRPHLAVRAGLITAVVGPMVLPGRSSCLLCALRYRSESDGGRAEVEQGMRREVVLPPAQLVAAASVLAVNEVLDHLDGISVPSTVDGTVEWQLGTFAPRRRSWSVHPECGCGRDGRPSTVVR